MKKFATCLISILFLLGSVLGLGGCTLLSTNGERYYKQVVAYIGDETITREELTNYYSNYSYYTSYGYTQEQVFDMVYNMLVNQKILLQEAKKNVTLTTTEKNEVWKSVRESIDGYLDSYEDEVRKLLGASERDSSDEDEETELKAFEQYARTVVSKARTADTDEVVSSGYIIPKQNENFYRYLAFNRYLNALVEQSRINGEIVDKQTAFEREIERLYKSHEDNKYISIYQEMIKSGIVISNSEIVERFKILQSTQIQSYIVSGTYEKLATNSAPSEYIYYHNSDARSYFAVQQILIQFSDEQKELLHGHDGYVSSKSSTYSFDEALFDSYIEYRDTIAKEIKITFTDENGEEKEGDFNAIWAEISALVADYNDVTKTAAYKNNTLLAEEFWKLKYYYSSDQLSSDSKTVTVRDTTELWNIMGYSFSTDSTKENSFVSEFSDCAYDLLSNFDENGEYTIGYCVTDYGVHFMMFTGVNVGGSVAEANYEALSTTRLSIVTNETIADYIYEVILAEKQSSIISNKLSELYSIYSSEKKIVKKVKSYSDFIK